MKKLPVPSPENWLKKAVSKDNPSLKEPHGNVSSDGFRMHRVKSMSFDPKPGAPNFDIIWEQVKPNNNLCIISRDELMLACLRAKAIIQKNNHNYPMKISINGNLEYSATCEEIGTTTGFIPCEHSGDDITLTVNATFLYDALSGMKSEVWISVRAADRPIYITDHLAEAVLMPLRMN